LSSQVLTPQQLAEPGLQAWTRFLRAHAAITRELSARLEAQHALTLTDYDVLIQLYHAPERRMRRIDLSRQVLLTASGITRLLDGLEACGLVKKERCDSDARVTYAALTERGVRKCEEASESHLADVEELFAANFDPAERAALAELLGRLPLAHTSEACTS
jgi:DNA-binding MarR family transcriptional regulator